MGTYNFKKDLKESEKSVNLVIEKLKEQGCTDVETNDDGRYDIIFTRDGKQFTAEVKNDLMWETTKNVAIEFESRKKPSGISTSKADYWFYVLGEQIYICTTGSLRVFLVQHWDRFRRVKGGDDGTSQLALIRLTDFFDIFMGV